MNEFLAPIHYVMYEKILFLNDFVINYEELAQEHNVELVELKDLGEIEKAPLSKIIDHDNIHNWLLERVEIVEKKLAYIVSEILKKDENLIIEILKFSYRKGRAENFVGNAEDAFKLIISKFLDGMPCDGAISIIKSSEDLVKFSVEIDTHEKYWNYDISSNIYWDIRNKYIKGLLSSSRYNFVKTDELYEIRG